MRFVKKGQSPECFEDEKSSRNFNEKTKWKRFGNPCKKKLTDHVKKEQNYLCIYCECDVGGIESNVHLEHVKPQSKYPEHRWDYNNLVVSCVGYDTHRKKEKQSCGSHTHDDYNESLFLNPVQLVDIFEYFVFAIKSDRTNNIEEGMIFPANNENKYEKAKHTIECLGLNADHLIRERIVAKELFTDLSREPDFDVMATLDESPPFVSFLRYCFLPSVENVV